MKQKSWAFWPWSKDQLSFMKAIQKKLLYIYSICYMNISSLMRKQSFCGSSKEIKPFSLSKNYWSVFSEFQNVLVYLGHIVGFKEFNFYTLVENSKNTSKQLHPLFDLEYFTSIRYSDMDKRRQKKKKKSNYFRSKFSSVQALSRVQLFATQWTAAHQASLSIINSQIYRNSCPLSWCCHPTISSSVIPFSSHHQSFPASGSFQRSQFFASGGRNIGVSASASV